MEVVQAACRVADMPAPLDPNLFLKVHVDRST